MSHEQVSTLEHSPTGSHRRGDQTAPYHGLHPRIELQEDQAIGVRVLQMSACESRLISPVVVEQNSILLFRIDDDSDAPLFSSCGVVHWMQRLQQGCELGLYLDRELPQDFLVWPAWDRRQTLRYPLNLAARVCWNGARESQAVTLLNYSINGVAILTDEPGHVGEELEILTTDFQGKELLVKGVVCWQVKSADGYLTGCELSEQAGRLFAGKYEQRGETRC